MALFIPAKYVKTEEWDTDLELYSVFNVPIPVGTFRMRPFSIGVFSVLESIDAAYIKSPESAELIDLWRVLYINEFRRECAAEVYDWIQDGGIENEINLSLPATIKEWDDKVISWGVANFPVDHYDIPNQIRISQIIQTCFLGFRMIPGGKPTQEGILYGADTIASLITGLCQTLQSSYEEIFWNVPVALLGHAMAALSKANGQKGIERPKDPKDLERLFKEGKIREENGILHPWQIMDPVWHRPSPEQIEVNPEITEEHSKLIEIFNKNSKAKQPYSQFYDSIYEQYKEILDTVA